MYKSTIVHVALSAMVLATFPLGARPPGVKMLGVAPLVAQAPTASLSLDEGQALFVRNSPELHLARGRLLSRLGEAVQERAFENPTASFTNEDLGEYSERYFNLSQPLDFLWAGAGRGRRASALSATARAEFRADSARLVLGYREAFVDAWRRGEEVSALATVGLVVDELLEDATIRFASGDLAGYDLRRLRVVRSSVARRLMRAEITLADAELKLGALVAEDGGISRVRAETPELGVSTLPSGVDVTARALAQRGELAAAQARADAARATARMARRSLLTGTAVTSGFKQQSDGREGFFIGFQVPVPMLDRRSGAADAAQGAVDGASSELELVRRAIEREVAIAESRFESMRLQQTLLDEGGGEQLLDIARIAYAEGEVGIVELVDASDAFLDSRLMDADIRAETWLAHFQLEHAMGGLEGAPGTGGGR